VLSTRICEWLSENAHFNIFVQAHKNADEPAASLQLWHSGRTLAAVFGKSYGSCNKAFNNSILVTTISNWNGYKLTKADLRLDNVSLS
jgi:hypothetical protein